MNWRDSLNELRALKPDWNGYGEPALDPDTLTKAEAVIGAMLSPEDHEPSVVPTSLGGVQFEWHRNGQDLEIEFVPGREPEADWNGSVFHARALLRGLR